MIGEGATVAHCASSTWLGARQIEESWGRQGCEELTRGHVGLVVPACLVEKIDGAQRATAPHHGHVEDRGAAERQDQLVVEEDASDVVGRASDVRPPLD